MNPTQSKIFQQALLTQLQQQHIPALILTPKGEVLHTNQLITAVTTEAKHWRHFCLNYGTEQPRGLPADKSVFVYCDPRHNIRTAFAMRIPLPQSSCSLLLLVEPQALQFGSMGFVIFDPTEQCCYWSEKASRQHGELHYRRVQDLPNFLHWYHPAQRDRLLYVMLHITPQSPPQQVTLTVAHSGQRVRYLWLPLQMQGKYFVCAFVRSLKVPQHAPKRQQQKGLNVTTPSPFIA